MSDYERQREENILRNKQKLLELGIAAVGFATPPPKPPSSSSKSSSSKRRASGNDNDDDINGTTNNNNTSVVVKRKPSMEPTRRSSRTVGKKPEYTGELIDRFGDELDAAEESRQAKMLVDHAERVKLANEEAIERCRVALEKQRNELLLVKMKLKQEQEQEQEQGQGQGQEQAEKQGKNAGDASANLKVKKEGELIIPSSPPQFKDAWHKEAVALWGPALQRPDHVSDWKAFVESRRATPFSGLPSPYALMQERFCGDGWRLLITCCLISRVNSVDVKERCTNAFFATCPTPSAVLTVDPKDLQPQLCSLGLFPDRMATIVEITRAWLNRPVFEVGLDEPQKIRGVGVFAVDSYRLFVLDDLACRPQDKNLLAFSRWRLSQ